MSNNSDAPFNKETKEKMIGYITLQELDNVITEEQADYLCDVIEYPDCDSYSDYFDELNFNNIDDAKLNENLNILIDRVLIVWLLERTVQRDPELTKTYRWAKEYFRSHRFD